jgi:hypothetical protein
MGLRLAVQVLGCTWTCRMGLVDPSRRADAQQHLSGLRTRIGAAESPLIRRKGDQP